MEDIHHPRTVILAAAAFITIAAFATATRADTPPNSSRPAGLTAKTTSGIESVGASSDATKTKGDKSPPPLSAFPPGKSKSSTTASTPENTSPEMTIEQFLDRLMVAESGGNDQARNPLSTATGAYQFIESTFLWVMRRHFPDRIEKLATSEILALRTDRQTARDAAKAFTQDNATQLAAAGHASSFPNLRLAFLLGVGGAIEILDAKPETPLTGLVGPAVIRANPWMSRHTASTLIARAAREVSQSPDSLAGVKPLRDPITGKLILPKHASTRPSIRIRCNLARPSCKRWLSLKRRALANKPASRSKRRVAESR